MEASKKAYVEKRYVEKKKYVFKGHFLFYFLFSQQWNNQTQTQ